MMRWQVSGNRALLALLLFLALAILVAGLIVAGVAGASAWLHPFLRSATLVVIQALALGLVPLSLWRRTRVFAGNGIIFASYLFAATLWTWSFALTYDHWGAVGVILGLLLLGLGIVPVAMLAALLHAEWNTLGELALLLLLAIGARSYGFWLLRKSAREQLEARMEREQP